MAVLLAFNNADVLTMKELKAVTSLQDGELHKQVQTLVDAKLLTTQVSTKNTLGNMYNILVIRVS